MFNGGAKLQLTGSLPIAAVHLCAHSRPSKTSRLEISRRREKTARTNYMALAHGVSLLDLDAGPSSRDHHSFGVVSVGATTCIPLK